MLAESERPVNCIRMIENEIFTDKKPGVSGSEVEMARRNTKEKLHKEKRAVEEGCWHRTEL